MSYQEEQFVIRPAVRHAVPQMMAVWGPTFSGKTYSAILLAAGLLEPGGKIAMVDTEVGRGSAAADDEDVRNAIPRENWVDGAPYAVIELHPPYHPRRYIGAYRALERAGYTVIITDSGSHAWSEEGGALDMKEKDKSWVNAKLWTKRFSSAIRYSTAHHIVCLRAEPKTKIITVNGKQEYVPIGVRPICERTFPFDLGFAFSVEGEVDGKPATHLATAFKWPKGMNKTFENWAPQLLTSNIGKKIKEWNNAAPVLDNNDRLIEQSRSVADGGMDAYKAFFSGLSATQKKALESVHAENKVAAERADKESLQPEEESITSSVTNITTEMPTRDTATGNLGEAGTTFVEEIATHSTTTNVASVVEAKPALAPEIPQAEGPPEYRRHLHMWRELLGWPTLLEIFGAFGFDHGDHKLADIPEDHYIKVKNALLERAQDLGKPLPDFDKPQTGPLGTVVKPTFGEPVVKTRRR